MCEKGKAIYTYIWKVQKGICYNRPVKNASSASSLQNSLSIHRNNQENANEFRKERGVREGYFMSSTLFPPSMEYLCKQIDWYNAGVNINGENLNHLKFERVH